MIDPGRMVVSPVGSILRIEPAEALDALDAILPYFPEDGHFAEASINLFLEFYKSQKKINELPPLTAILDSNLIDQIHQGR